MVEYDFVGQLSDRKAKPYKGKQPLSQVNDQLVALFDTWMNWLIRSKIDHSDSITDTTNVASSPFLSAQGTESSLLINELVAIKDTTYVTCSVDGQANIFHRAKKSVSLTIIRQADKRAYHFITLSHF